MIHGMCILFLQNYAGEWCSEGSKRSKEKKVTALQREGCVLVCVVCFFTTMLERITKEALMKKSYIIYAIHNLLSFRGLCDEYSFTC